MNELREGLVLMVFGMGTVLLFLSLMVVVMLNASKVLSRFSHLFPEPQLATPRRPAPKKDDMEQIAVAIAVANSRSRHIG